MDSNFYDRITEAVEACEEHIQQQIIEELEEFFFGERHGLTNKEFQDYLLNKRIPEIVHESVFGKKEKITNENN